MYLQLEDKKCWPINLLPLLSTKKGSRTFSVSFCWGIPTKKNGGSNWNSKNFFNPTRSGWRWCSPTFMVVINRKTTTPGDKTALHHVPHLLLEHSDLPTNSMPSDLLTLLPVATLARRSPQNQRRRKKLQAPSFRNNRTWKGTQRKKRFTTTRNLFLKKMFGHIWQRQIQRKFSA